MYVPIRRGIMKSYRSFPGLFLILFLMFGISSASLALEVPVFSPLRYSIDNVQGTAVYTDTVTMGNVVSGEFHLIVQNGSGGANKVDYAEVYVAGKRLVKMKSTKDLIDKKFKLLKDSEMRIQLTGPKNSFVVVSIIAKKLTQVPLVIRMAQADAQAAMTASLLKIKKKPTFSSHGFVPSGSVISQTPSPGVYVKEKSKASITVSTGPEQSYALLPGTPETPASSAVVDYSSHDRVTDSEIEELALNVRIARTKLEIGFTSTATVKEVNDLLTSIGAQITAMLKGVNQVIVRIPDPGNMTALDALVAQIESSPIVRYVLNGNMASPSALPPWVTDPTDPFAMIMIDHHLGVRAHAAWNAKSLLAQKPQPPHLIVVDHFGDGQPNQDFAVNSSSWDFATGNRNPHGYHVLGVIAATFGGSNTDRGQATGIYPASGYLPSLWAIDKLFGYDLESANAEIINRLTLLGGNVVVNTSQQLVCNTSNPLDKSCIPRRALSWIEKVRGPILYPTGQTGPESLENSFIHVTAAGNVMTEGDTDARYASGHAAARLLTTLIITETATPVMNLNNTLVIENREQSAEPLEGLGCLNTTSVPSMYPGDLSGIGTDVWSLTGADAGADFATGTSMAAPQVAGLAAYLWAIKPGLSPQQIVDILVRTADASPCGGVDARPLIDAYAAVLALDRNYPDMEVRRAILDLNEDRFFDEKDVEKFLTEFDTANGAKDYSRYDLNGDGQTGGDSKAKFNLDMDYPPTYTSVSQTIEDNSVSFNENSLTDLQILCYYAYSRLYTGDTDKRKDLLGEKCGKGDADVYLSYFISDCSYNSGGQGSDEPGGSMLLELGEYDSYTPLPLPVNLAPSCSPYAEQTTTVQQIDPSQITISSSGWAKRINVPCNSPPPQCPSNGISTVRSHSNSRGRGQIIAGTYTVEISPSPTFNLPMMHQTFTAYLGFVCCHGSNARQVTCQWRQDPEGPYAQCCYYNGFTQMCYPAGSIEVDIEVPEATQWYFLSSLDAGTYGDDPPADVSASAIFSIKPKQ